jgi:hypothetical protein
MDSSKITLALTSGHKLIPFGKREAVVEISGKEAIEVYWESVDSIFRTLIWNYSSLLDHFDQVQPPLMNNR